nr:DUF4219 domain-containing protein/UBN2 domain-containing protein [Tanacetum cinerariifolium]
MSTVFQCSGVPDRASGMSTLFQCLGVPDRASGMSTLFQCSGVPDRASDMSTLIQCSGVPGRAFEVVPFEEQSDDLKKKLAKNNEAKMILYNALPKKEYERILMCKMDKDIWQSLLITHQGNSQVKDNKTNFLVQQYEQFTILEEESIDSGFARFNTIITSVKALDEGFSSKNYVRKFLRALHPKWRAKVMSIEESKDLSSLVLDLKDFMELLLLT